MSARFLALSAALLVLTGALLCGDSPSRAEQTPARKAAQATSPEMAVRQALTKPVNVKCNETSLADFAKSLERVFGEPVRLDHRALNDIGLGDAAPVTFQVSGISARSALELMLRQLDLTWVIDQKVVLITTPEEAETRLETKVYDVADLFGQGSGSGQFDVGPLMEAITACIEPVSWDFVGGSGTIRARLGVVGTRVLEISQTQYAHEEIDTLLADLRQAGRGKPGGGNAGGRRETTEMAPHGIEQKRRSAEQAIRRSLSKPVKLDFKETPLDDVVEYLNRKAGIQIIIDRKALDDVGLGIDTPVTVRVDGIKLRSALDFMLGPHDLTWTIAHEVLLITTLEEAENMLPAKVYDVSDFPAYRNEQGQGVPDYDSLVEMIAACIEPTSWDSVGGPGSIAPFHATGVRVLLIAQTREVHEEVDALLGKLRKVRGKELSTEDLNKLPPADRLSRPP